MLFYDSINKFIMVKLLKVKVCCCEFLSENTGIVQGEGGADQVKIFCGFDSLPKYDKNH